MALNGHSAPSRQLAARCPTATGVLMSTSSIRQHIPGAIFQQDNSHPHVAKTFQDFCSAEHMEILPWPIYSLDMLPIEHV
ncbi:transposable element Tcb2 transposase [Trichonephila clavipes]|nr:transposable element Tcb2 transposase [Trichonephila clavipes]